MKHILFCLLFATSALAQPILTTGPAAGTFPFATLNQSAGMDTITANIKVGQVATAGGNVATIDIGQSGDYDIEYRIYVNGKLVQKGRTCLNRFIYIASDGAAHPEGTKIEARYILRKKRV